MKHRIAILTSGNGTNAENIIRYFSASSQVQVGLVVANVQQAFALNRARQHKVPCAYFSKDFWTDGHAILAVLRSYNIDFVVLAGFLARIPDAILQAYPDRMVNIHPSLLPLHGGKGMYGDHVHEDVLRCGDKETGITIHYTNEHYDAGQVILQAKCPVLPEDTAQTLAARVHALEYEHYPRVIERLLQGE